jgi:BirA family biotin operon repressor/biotin-[acetyl-CoA-carboxylase] ligase
MTAAPTTGAGEPLDRDAVMAALGPAAGVLRALDIVAVTGSTNEDLLAGPAGDADRRALLAEQQTGGRGRRGRAWFSPPRRNVYLSLGWRLHAPLEVLAFLPLVAPLAVIDALEGLGATGVGVKWPNDLVTDQGKLGGCLVELRPDGAARLAVIGVGLNVHLSGAPGVEAIDQAWVDLDALVSGISRSRVAGRMLGALVEAVQRFEHRGFEPFRAAWSARDVLAGREVELRAQAGDGSAAPRRGVCRGLGPGGGLLLERDGEVREFFAGDVSARPVADDGRPGTPTGQK